MPRRLPVSYVYTDTPEIQALGAGFARQGYFRQGYGKAREFGNELAMRSTAVPAGQKAQIAFLAGRYGAYGEDAGKFLQPISGANVSGRARVSTGRGATDDPAGEKRGSRSEKKDRKI